ncbi:MAG: GGDEF domain-containing protein [Burkholderiaceae bacterium]|nr:GGDEF domain-containing protein [Roseateles sp.]MBV8470493.1 GGDEF domain-containing protein [Burkholderiaceae bacterium]
MRRSLPASVGGLALWGVAPLLALVSTVFYGLEGSAAPVVVLLGGNGMLLACATVMMAGTQRFYGETVRWRPWSAVGLASLGGTLIFFQAWPDYRWRLLIFTLGMSVICGAHTWLLWRRGSGFAARLAFAAMLSQTAILLLRAASTFWIDQATTRRFDTVSTLHTVYLASYGFVMILVLVAAQLMAAERVRAEFEHMATHDGLTGLLNRNRLLQLGDAELSRWRRYAQPFAILLIDIDHFKRINDTLGHLAGDRALVRCARTLSQSLRACDRLARFGGEEFMALLPATDAPAALALAERLRAMLERLPAEPDGPACTASVGVTVVRATDTSLTGLIARADAALYQAKAAGRNRVVQAD